MANETEDTIQQGTALRSQKDVSNENVAFDSDDAVADALFSKWVPDAEEPSGTGEDDDQPKDKGSQKKSPSKSVDKDQTNDEDDDDEPQDDEDNEGDTDEPERKYVEEDGAYVKVKVGDEDLEIPVKDLKRLAGQEAAFTRKGQELATARKTVEEVGQLQVQVFDKLLEAARAAWEPYSKLDLLTLARNPDITTEQVEAVRQEAERRWNELQFLEKGVRDVSTSSQKAVSERKAAEAKACIDALSDPLSGIEGFGEPLYNELLQFAVDAGVSKELLEGLTDPGTYKVFYKAMQFDRAKQKVTKIKDQNKADKKPPKKIVKSSKSVRPQRGQLEGSKVDAKAQTLKQSGRTDDAAELLLAKWSFADDADD